MNNRLLLERSLAAVWHPCTQMRLYAGPDGLPLVPIARGDGVWLYDFDGNRYLDAISSWWVNLFGHGNPRIGAAIKEQIDRLEHVLLAGFTHEPVVQLSERLSALTGGAPASREQGSRLRDANVRESGAAPHSQAASAFGVASALRNHAPPSGGALGHCFYASDGASATEIALKMSFHYWRNRGKPQKRDFVGVQNGYHGETIGALSVTDVAIFKDAYAPLLRQAATVPSPDSRLAEPGESAEAYALRCVEALERYFQEHHATTAAFIVEPLVQCAAGMAMHHPIYLRRVRELCDRYEVHWIADEIAVGFGRTGTMFAHAVEPLSPREGGRGEGALQTVLTSGLSPPEVAGSIRPDFLCLSKGISGGYLPLSVVMTTDEVYDAFYDDEVARGFLHSHSYTGNALACRAALAVLDIFEQDQVIEANRSTAARLTGLAQGLARHPGVAHFRNCGMIWAFDVKSADPKFARRFYTEALKSELLLRPIGNTVYFMPPYVIDAERCELLVSRTLALVERLIGG